MTTLREDFREMSSAVVIQMGIGFVLFLLFPAGPPRYYSPLVHGGFDPPALHSFFGLYEFQQGVFDTADHPLCLAPGNDRLWARCAQALGHPEWGTDPKFAKTAQRVANKAELLPMIAAVMRTRPRAEWLAALEKAGVPCSPVNDIAELAATDQLAAVDLVRRLPVRPGEESAPEVVGLPICFDRQRPRSARSAPKLGEHTREVLGDG